MKHLFRFFFLVFSINLVAQDSSSVNFGFESNAQYYMDDEITGDFSETNRFRSNNYLKTEYINNQFTVGFQLESYAPQSLLNFASDYNKKIGIGMYYAQYTGEKTTLNVGHFFEQYGNGLILRIWEDRILGINNALMGLKVKTALNDDISVSGFIGKQRAGFKLSEGVLFGADLNIELPTLFQNKSLNANLGISYIGRYDITEDENAVYPPITSAFSVRSQLNYNSIYFGVEGVVKSKDAYVESGTIYTDKSFYGNALQLNLGYAQKGLGINATIRRMENMDFYSDRATTGNFFNQLIVNYLPALTKQHDYTLANMYVYKAQPTLQFSDKFGELGGQIDIFYNFKKESVFGGKYGTKLSFNYATWYGLFADYNTDFKRVNISYFKTDEHYFSDFSIELRKKLSESFSGILTFINSFYNKKYIEDAYGIIHSNIIVAEGTVKTNESASIRIEGQHLWTKEDRKNWAASIIEWNMNNNFSVFASDQYNYLNDDKNLRAHYYLFGGSYSKERTRVALNYGRQRGGVLCVGGVCRDVPPATGLTLNLTTSF